MAQRKRWHGRPTVVPEAGAGRCTGCGRCVAACPLRLLSLEVVAGRKLVRLEEPERCDSCGRCVVACPFDAIRLSVPGEELHG